MSRKAYYCIDATVLPIRATGCLLLAFDACDNSKVSSLLPCAGILLAGEGTSEYTVHPWALAEGTQ